MAAPGEPSMKQLNSAKVVVLAAHQGLEGVAVRLGDVGGHGGFPVRVDGTGGARRTRSATRVSTVRRRAPPPRGSTDGGGEHAGVHRLGLDARPHGNGAGHHIRAARNGPELEAPNAERAYEAKENPACGERARGLPPSGIGLRSGPARLQGAPETGLSGSYGTGTSHTPPAPEGPTTRRGRSACA